MAATELLDKTKFEDWPDENKHTELLFLLLLYHAIELM